MVRITFRNASSRHLEAADLQRHAALTDGDLEVLGSSVFGSQNGPGAETGDQENYALT